ncbi:MAG TPA: cbb3-type cytochrome c oxidase subunit II [Mucilaginibacter sp.]|nr:cbb3-type cytochrome c oxidase subunit II [Mucilaginibacter sp.]
MEIYNNHKRLFGAAIILFIVLTMFAAILPAFNAEKNDVPLPGSKPLTADEMAGKGIYIREGCIACHTQQVRDVDMDRIWGSRPGIAADFARIKRTDIWRNTAMLMGSERTGPDLTNIGVRQPSQDWLLLHFYNPRAVVQQSIMPAYPWLFEVKDYPFPGDVVVHVPDEFRKGVTGQIVATKEAMQLVAYLKSLKQVSLPDGKPTPLFLYGKDSKESAIPPSSGTNKTTAAPQLDGAALYTANCSSCHQPNGEGLIGAFPALKGSKVVLNDNPETQITIIMQGYNGRVSEGYGVMPPVGTNNNLKPEEIVAIINHERTSWGNNSKQVTMDDVKKVIAGLKQEKNTIAK